MTRADILEVAAFTAEQVCTQVIAKLNVKRWMTLEEAKDYARVKSTTTVMAWIDKGYIYGFKRTGEWIIDRESIDDWYGSER